MSEIPEIAFDSNNASMIAFTVRTKTNDVVEQSDKMKHFFENNTVSIFGKLMPLMASELILKPFKLGNND